MDRENNNTISLDTKIRSLETPREQVLGDAMDILKAEVVRIENEEAEASRTRMPSPNEMRRIGGIMQFIKMIETGDLTAALDAFTGKQEALTAELKEKIRESVRSPRLPGQTRPIDTEVATLRLELDTIAKNIDSLAQYSLDNSETKAPDVDLDTGYKQAA